MLNKYKASLFSMSLCFVLLSLNLSIANAEDDDEGSSLPLLINSKWKEECSGCHIAYPPRFLPSKAWREIMSNLGKHFGSDASIDAGANPEITEFLEHNADRHKSPAGNKLILRISETRWFKSAHQEVSSRAWKKPQVKSASNCIACHRQADLGDFSERNARVPR
jgi:hypothetical protein